MSIRLDYDPVTKNTKGVQRFRALQVVFSALKRLDNGTGSQAAVDRAEALNTRLKFGDLPTEPRRRTHPQ